MFQLGFLVIPLLPPLFCARVFGTVCVRATSRELYVIYITVLMFMWQLCSLLPPNISIQHVRFGWNDRELLLLADLMWEKNTVLTYNPRSFTTKRTGRSSCRCRICIRQNAALFSSGEPNKTHCYITIIIITTVIYSCGGQLAEVMTGALHI